MSIEIKSNSILLSTANTNHSVSSTTLSLLNTQCAIREKKVAGR